jgi:TDG/mug DNA glycosylase family protein
VEQGTVGHEYQFDFAIPENDGKLSQNAGLPQPRSRQVNDRSAGRMRRPTKSELQEATGRTVPDVIAHRLDVLFCGINPGLYSGATGHHFARPGNRFWPALHGAGFTNCLLAPSEEHLLLDYGCGITNLVTRTTAAAAELDDSELVRGRRNLARKVKRNAPRWLAILGIGAYRTAFGRRAAHIGEQPERMGPTGLWVLPNPSGLNANYQLPELIRLFGELRAAVSSPISRGT